METLFGMLFGSCYMLRSCFWPHWELAAVLAQELTKLISELIVQKISGRHQRGTQRMAKKCLVLWLRTTKKWRAWKTDVIGCGHRSWEISYSRTMAALQKKYRKHPFRIPQEYMIRAYPLWFGGQSLMIPGSFLKILGNFCAHLANFKGSNAMPIPSKIRKKTIFFDS